MRPYDHVIQAGTKVLGLVVEPHPMIVT